MKNALIGLVAALPFLVPVIALVVAFTLIGALRG